MTTADYDVIIVGAGFGGLCALAELRKHGLSARVLEQGGGVGGTWYWNRYPGARCDSESIYYMFTDWFSKEILAEWTWSERFAAQAEIRAYLEFVTEKMDLRRDIQFNTCVESCVYDEESNTWWITPQDGVGVTSRYLITAVGCISARNVPPWPGLDRFAGEWFHTGAWPHEPVNLCGKRVAVIGTGSSGVQVIPEIAKVASRLYVFQRAANYVLPARNRRLAAEYVKEIKADYKNIWQKARATGFGLPFQVANRRAQDFSEDERARIYQDAWDKGGFHIGLGTFSDLLVNKESNDTVTAFFLDKMSKAVDDPALVELLAPKDHPFFTKRPPMHDDYYQVFKRENVSLIDVRAAPIEEITQAGVQTADREYAVDVIVFATGFDAMTGSLFALSIQGKDGQTLQSKWADGPRTYLGMMTTGFPNLFMITGPQSPSVLSNVPVSIEQNVQWIGNLLAHLRLSGFDYVEATEHAEENWVSHHNELAQATLLPLANSWWVGANIPGKPRTVYPYVGGVDQYGAKCADVAAKGYEGLALEAQSVPKR